MAEPAVHLASQGHFFVGVRYREQDGQTVVDGEQIYVEYQTPAEETGYPVVLVHGGGGQGTDWMATPDGRPGWRTLLLQRGHAVYVVDRPGHGRSPRPDRRSAPDPNSPAMVPSVEMIGAMFAGRDNPAHTQWPGAGDVDDPALGQFLASQNPDGIDFALDHELMRRLGADLLDRVGPAIVITNSAGGPSGWLMADTRPDLVKAVVGLEPLGPGMVALPWGLAAAPIEYDPPASAPADLRLVRTAREPGPFGAFMQAEPSRRLTNLANIPIAVVSGEQSFALPGDVATVAFLQQAGCRTVEHLRLGDLGVHGNGHLMMIERNNAAVLDVVLDWLGRHVDAGPTGAGGSVSSASPAAR